MVPKRAINMVVQQKKLFADILRVAVVIEPQRSFR